uniref:ATP synthase complex subunit 8 n=1 Tax=Bifiditermes rogierae TaxID=2942683 RepID=A0A8X8RGP6_9NEOP|nr:ATP synthase F0 subunit 8 [Bifiditermes rogierae]
MPQMMPMNWVTLFIMFSATLIIFATMNFYTKMPKPKHSTKSTIAQKLMNWKW